MLVAELLSLLSLSISICSLKRPPPPLPTPLTSPVSASTSAFAPAITKPPTNSAHSRICQIPREIYDPAKATRANFANKKSRRLELGVGGAHLGSEFLSLSLLPREWEGKDPRMGGDEEPKPILIRRACAGELLATHGATSSAARLGKGGGGTGADGRMAARRGAAACRRAAGFGVVLTK
jgi:hypothetical protein